MRAWQYSSTKGGIDKQLKINSSVPLPKQKSDQHLVQIIASALNPVDYKPVESIPGVFRFGVSKPATPGIDYAGTIVKPAQGSSLKSGQLVFGCSGANGPLAGGALREFTTTGKDSTVAVPKHLDPIDAATVGIAGLTAYQSTVPHIKKNDRVFINGGSGGTGIFGIQFAKVIGCHITTTCSTPNVELVKSLGADRVIDYKKENVLEALQNIGDKFDHAVDNVGTQHELPWHCHEFMKPNAKYVVVGGEPTLDGLGDMMKQKLLPKFLGGVKGNVEGFWPQQKPEDLGQIAEWMADGKVKTMIDSRFKFEEAPQAFEKLKTGRAKGKIVVDVDVESYKKGGA